MMLTTADRVGLSWLPIWSVRGKTMDYSDSSKIDGLNFCGPNRLDAIYQLASPLFYQEFLMVRLDQRTVLWLGCSCLIALLCTAIAHGDGLRDNNPEAVRRIPKLGIELTAEQRQKIEAKLAKLDRALEDLQDHPLVVDATVMRRAIWSALEYREFFSAKELSLVDKAYDVAMSRVDSMKSGNVQRWSYLPGLNVSGFISKIDGTPQPYGLVIPDSYRPDGDRKYRLDLWFHGRGESTSELKFINERLRNKGRYAPEDTIVLHPYGRYSNAFKFAGEVDVLEAVADAKRRLRIDDDRISVRGFSMGGAGCWQMAVHYPDLFFAANPGAGFSETPEFLKFFQKEKLQPTWYEKKLWHMYDCTDWAINLAQLPTIAYSGELDIQKQAADIMQVALQKEGIDLLHVIGPQTKHTIHPNSMAEIETRMASVAEIGRDRFPRDLHFQTWTLKYNRMHWLTIDALTEHWSKARIDLRTVEESGLYANLEGIEGFTIDIPAGRCWLKPEVKSSISIYTRWSKQRTVLPLPVKSDRSLRVSFYRDGDDWKIRSRPLSTLRKRHDLQGPIDDAFMDSFLIVRPTGKSRHAQVDQWVQSELEHAIVHWRQQFRGEARVKDDVDVTDEDIQQHHLILFGTPESNRLLGNVSKQLPILWTADGIQVGERQFDASQHALALIYPNPQNSERYVVLNSGFTYREYDYLNNARQVPKLPDWAVFDLRTAPNSQRAGAIADADFFGEAWELQPPHAERIDAAGASERGDRN